jgi:hypothetical protein
VSDGIGVAEPNCKPRDQGVRVGEQLVDSARVVFISENTLSLAAESYDYDSLIDRALDISKRRLFLSYAGEDRVFADRIAEALAHAAIRVWYAPWELAVGDSIVDKINDGIRGSAFLAVVLSPDSVSKPWCKTELNAALHIKLRNQGIRILPVLYRQREVPPLFLDVFFADFRSSFEQGMKDLLRALER